MESILPKFWKIEVRENTALGRGVFATDKIVDGEIIFKFAGPKMTLMDFFDKYETNGCNVLQIDRDLYIDTIEPYVYVNHSCEPNAGIRNDGVLFAIKNISKGDEITFDYSTTVDDVIWRMECKCGSKNCRKIIGDFQTIPHDRKEFYLKKNALLRYIKQMYY